MIGTVLERNNQVIVYDEKNRQTACVFLSGGKLLGYTSNSFSIKRGCAVYTYNEKGKQTGMKIG